jgi:hypothetical protein
MGINKRTICELCGELGLCKRSKIKLKTIKACSLCLIKNRQNKIKYLGKLPSDKTKPKMSMIF